MVSQLQNLPTIKTIGTLEPVAYFEGAMPTGVTVSHQGRILLNPFCYDEAEIVQLTNKRKEQVWTQ